MTTGEFWEQQKFSYLVTYSFNRGPLSVAMRETLAKAIEQARADLSVARYMQRAKITQQLRELEAELNGGIHSQKLTVPTREDEPFAATKAIALVKQGSNEAQHLGAVLQRPIKDLFYAMCPPVYRDALVFYDEQGKVLQVLNICFECRFMETESGEIVKADWSTYEALREMLIRLGHSITESGW